MNEAYCKLATLLDYPGEECRQALWELTGMFPDHDFSTIQGKFCDLIKIQEIYTRTFDMRETTTLYLTFYYSGYTRDRGMDLLRLKTVLMKHGIRQENQAPDFLPLLLRLSCLDQEGVMILAKYRQAIELISKRLKDESNPYSTLFDLLLRLVPRTSNEQKVEEKPTVEKVGLGDLG